MCVGFKKDKKIIDNLTSFDVYSWNTYDILESFLLDCLLIDIAFFPEPLPSDCLSTEMDWNSDFLESELTKKQNSHDLYLGTKLMFPPGDTSII